MTPQSNGSLQGIFARLHGYYFPTVTLGRPLTEQELRIVGNQIVACDRDIRRQKKALRLQCPESIKENCQFQVSLLESMKSALQDLQQNNPMQLEFLTALRRWPDLAFGLHKAGLEAEQIWRNHIMCALPQNRPSVVNQWASFHDESYEEDDPLIGVHLASMLMSVTDTNLRETIAASFNSVSDFRSGVPTDVERDPVGDIWSQVFPSSVCIPKQTVEKNRRTWSQMEAEWNEAKSSGFSNCTVQ